MKNPKQKITMDRQAAYQIEVPGILDSRWEELFRGLTVSTEYSERGWSTTTITGTFDQAALQGLLRRLYNHRVPLISVSWIAGE